MRARVAVMILVVPAGLHALILFLSSADNVDWEGILGEDVYNITMQRWEGGESACCYADWAR